jgi:hypothetical protein
MTAGQRTFAVSIFQGVTQMPIRCVGMSLHQYDAPGHVFLHRLVPNRARLHTWGASSTPYGFMMLFISAFVARRSAMLPWFLRRNEIVVSVRRTDAR